MRLLILMIKRSAESGTKRDWWEAAWAQRFKNPLRFLLSSAFQGFWLCLCNSAFIAVWSEATSSYPRQKPRGRLARRAAGHECPVIFANAKLCSGLERSDLSNGLQ